MPEDKDEYRSAQEDGAPEEAGYDLKSAKEAAAMLHISEATVWRYAATDLLPSYRVGRKRVMFRPSDLEALISRKRKGLAMAGRERLRLTAMAQNARTENVVTRAENLRHAILARRDGQKLTASWEDIDAAREERTSDL